MSNRTGYWALGVIAVVLVTILWLMILWLTHGGDAAPPVPTEADRIKEERARKAAIAIFKEHQQQRDRKLEQQHQEDLARDQEIKAAFEKSRTQRWTELPRGVRGVYVDRTGRAWLTLGRPNAGVEAKDTCLSVEEVSAGKAFCVRSDDRQPLLVDSRGTVWITMFGLLAGYDGKKWVYLDVSGAEVQRPTGPSPSRFTDLAFEDNAGGLWFVILVPRGNQPGVTKLFLHRNPRGKWLQHRVPGPEDFDLESLVSDGHVAQVEDGRMLIAPAGDTHRGLAYFNGSEWTVQENLAKRLNRQISWAAPMANGSMALLDYDIGDLWFYWPDPAKADNTETWRWIAALDAEDAGERRDATVALVRNGEAIRPVLERALANGGHSAEATLRLRSLLELVGKSSRDLSELAGENPDLPNRDLLRGMRFDHLSMVAWDAGKVVLRAEHCVDSVTGKHLGDRYVELIGNGRTRVMELSKEPWWPDSRNWMFSPFVDMQKRIWLPGGCRIRPDGIVEDALPPAVRASRVDGPDAQSRLYLDGRVILNESVPAAAPALSETFVEAPTSTFSIAGHVLWIADREGWPRRLSMMVDGKTRTRLDCPWVNAMPYFPATCFGPGVLLNLFGPDNNTNPDVSHALYDGSRWDTDDDLERLVKRNVGFMSKHANSTLRGDYLARFGGTADRFWFYHDRSGDEGGRALQLHDGQTWHDVGKTFKWDESNWPTMTLVDGGRSMLVVHSEPDWDKIALVTSGDGRVLEAQLRNVGRRQMGKRSPEAIYLADETWLRDLNNDGQLTVLRDGKLTDMPGTNDMLLGDSAGRGWLYDVTSKKLRVCDRGTWAETPIDGADIARAMGEDTTGRIWLLHGRAISHVAATMMDGKLIVKEVVSYPWNEPRNFLPKPGFDRAGGLWLSRPRGWTRIQLPPVQ